MNLDIIDKYKIASDKKEKIIRKYQKQRKKYSVNTRWIQDQFQQIQERKQALMKLIDGTQKQISKYFINYRPLNCNPVGFGDLKLSAEVKTAKNNGKVYVGIITKGKRHGKGVIFGKNGRIYEGQMQQNERCGLGVEIYQDLSFYVGNFYKNKRSGKGTLFYKKKQQINYYQGEWRDGRFHGFGFLVAGNKQYLGNFFNGDKNQYGIQVIKNQYIYQGNFIEDKREGPGFLYQYGEQIYDGIFKNAVKHGYGSWLSLKSFEEYQGFFQNDMKNGLGSQMKQGVKFTGNFKDNLPSSKGQYIYPKNKLSLCINNMETQTQLSKYRSKRKKLQKSKSIKQTTRHIDCQKCSHVPKIEDPCLLQKNIKKARIFSSRQYFKPNYRIHEFKSQQVIQSASLQPKTNICNQQNCNCGKWTKLSLQFDRLKSSIDSRSFSTKKLVSTKS